MKKLLVYFSLSLISALLAVILYTYFHKPHVIYVNTTPEHISHRTEYVKKDYISNSIPDFIEPSKTGRALSVYITSENQNQNNVSGSGVIIGPNGYIVTNEHVVRNETNLTVTLDDKREFIAEVIGRDAYTDLALLKIEAYNLPYATFGNSDSLEVGSWVLAVGNPFKLLSTVTAGIVSAKSRNINMLQNNAGIESYIQTDAAVNPGNSGGALLDSRGKLVGINAAIMAKSGKFEGYSFAIPSNLVSKIVEDFKTYGTVQRGWLGISIQDLNQKKADQLGISEVEGVYIIQVNKDGAASLAGLQPDDVITAIDNVPLNTTPQFMEIIGRYRPGDIINVQYLRNGEQKIVKIQLRNHINSTDLIAIHRDGILKDLGIEVRNMSGEEVKRNKRKGIYVVSIKRGSTIGRTKMEPGYIVTSLNGTTVYNVKAFITKLESISEKVEMEGFYESYPDVYTYLFIKE